MVHEDAWRTLLNRPFLAGDFNELSNMVWSSHLRSMVARYRERWLPVMNGSFEYSNLVEGPAQLSTLHPYRLWEYASLGLIRERIPAGSRILDVGGAASPLPYLLAGLGDDVLAIDLQPLLVALCNHVAEVEKLSLRAVVADITKTLEGVPLSSFDAITCVSVLEHIDKPTRRAAIGAIARLLKPGGVFYMTFDYGEHREETEYRRTCVSEVSESISDIQALSEDVIAAGLQFVGNDPAICRRLFSGSIRVLRRMLFGREWA